MKVPAILVINKADAFKKTKILTTIDNFSKLCEFSSIVPISALENDGVDIVLEELRPYLKNEPWFFEADMITDQPIRQIAAEVIREKLLRTLDDEIPHGVAVVIEEFEEKAKIINIRAELFCEKEAHKRIIIGKNGEALKKVGSFAREDLEKLFEKKIYLDLWVKVRENWRDSMLNLNRLGFKEDN
jgi:GTP-binding protein Era